MKTLVELRKKRDRDAQIIKMESDNHKDLTEAKDMLARLNQAHEKLARKKKVINFKKIMTFFFYYFFFCVFPTYA